MVEALAEDLAFETVIFHHHTIQKLMKQGKDFPSLFALYTFYVYHAHHQKTNSPLATNDFVRRGLGWSLDKVKRIKRALKELNLIEVVKRGKRFYVKLPYIYTKKRKQQILRECEMPDDIKEMTLLRDSNSKVVDEYMMEESALESLRIKNKRAKTSAERARERLEADFELKAKKLEEEICSPKAEEKKIEKQQEEIKTVDKSNFEFKREDNGPVQASQILGKLLKNIEKKSQIHQQNRENRESNKSVEQNESKNIKIEPSRSENKAKTNSRDTQSKDKPKKAPNKLDESSPFVRYLLRQGVSVDRIKELVAKVKSLENFEERYGGKIDMANLARWLLYCDRNKIKYNKGNLKRWLDRLSTLFLIEQPAVIEGAIRYGFKDLKINPSRYLKYKGRNVFVLGSLKENLQNITYVNGSYYYRFNGGQFKSNLTPKELFMKFGISY